MMPALGQAEVLFAAESPGASLGIQFLVWPNPAIIDVTVVVQERQPTMDDFALALSEALRRQGVRVAIRITADGKG